MEFGRTDALLGTRYAIASVDRGSLVDDLTVLDTYPSEREAFHAAEDLCSKMAGSETGLQPGEGYWIFELRPMRFVGRAP
jgi:hypothetical protein